VILCVAANPSIDRLFEVERLVPGAIHRPADFVQVAGGKGLNVARAAASLGGRVQAAAILGGHAGRWIAEQLEEEGIELHPVWAAAETRSSLSVAGAIEDGLRRAGAADGGRCGLADHLRIAAVRRPGGRISADGARGPGGARHA